MGNTWGAAVRVIPAGIAIRRTIREDGLHSEATFVGNNGHGADSLPLIEPYDLPATPEIETITALIYSSSTEGSDNTIMVDDHGFDVFV
jgi:hypothetical protein